MVLIGDIHGTLRTVVNEINNGTEMDIIQVGDFGLGFKSYTRDIENMNDLNELLKIRGKDLYVIRGNHDDPKFWNGDYEDKWSNIHLMEDFSMAIIDGQKVLFAGGAVSIDRNVRTLGIDHWKNVEFEYDEDDLLDVMEHLGVPDIVVTHTAPSLCHPRGFNDLVYSFASIDPDLLTDLRVERAQMDRMYDVIKSKGTPKAWVYGHFHNDVTEERDGTKFILLGIGSCINIKS